MNSEYIVCLQNFDKNFSTSEGPRVPPGGVNFSIVEIFPHFVFFVMRTPYELRIVCLQNYDKIFFRPSYQKSQIKKFLNKKNTIYQKTLQNESNKSIVSIDYQLKKRCFLIKGCAATIVFGPLILQNINRLSDVR